MLTPQQLAVLKTAITNETDPAFGALRTANNDSAMADWYNLDHATQMVWKPAIAVYELNAVVVWSEFEGRSIAQRDIWFALTQSDFVDTTKPSVRSGFAAALGAASASVTNLTALGQRKATRFEALFTTSNVSSVFGVRITDLDVYTARNS